MGVLTHNLERKLVVRPVCVSLQLLNQGNHVVADVAIGRQHSECNEIIHLDAAVNEMELSLCVQILGQLL